jgi:drug/metabolite transporter (DMT)-like permease
MGGPFVLFVALGLRLTFAAQAPSITPGLLPVFAGFFGWLMLHERPGRSRLAGYVCIIVGLTALIIDSTQAGGRPSLIGITSLILSAAMWATYTLSFRLQRFNAAAGGGDDLLLVGNFLFTDLLAVRSFAPWRCVIARDRVSDNLSRVSDERCCGHHF